MYLSNITASIKNHSMYLAATETTNLLYSGATLKHSCCVFKHKNSCVCFSCIFPVVRNSGEGAEEKIRTKERDGDMLMEFVMY